MGFYGQGHVYSATIASAATFSEAVDLKGYHQKMVFEVPSGVSANVKILAANNFAGTYRPLFVHTAGSSPPSAVQLSIPSATSNAMIGDLPCPGRFVKVETTTALADCGLFYFTVF